MKYQLLIIFLLSASVVFGQGKQMPVQEPVKSQLNTVLKSYLDLKNALVASNSKKSKEKAGELLANLNKVEESKMAAPQKEVFSKAKEEIKTHVEKISNTTELDKQREHFSPLSDGLFNVVKAFKISDQKLYRDYCPMANNDNGAYWISEKKEIANPYFGSKMMTCGEVKQTL